MDRLNEHVGVSRILHALGQESGKLLSCVLFFLCLWMILLAASFPISYNLKMKPSTEADFRALGGVCLNCSPASLAPAISSSAIVSRSRSRSTLGSTTIPVKLRRDLYPCFSALWVTDALDSFLVFTRAFSITQKCLYIVVTRTLNVPKQTCWKGFFKC